MNCLRDRVSFKKRQNCNTEQDFTNIPSDYNILYYHRSVTTTSELALSTNNTNPYLQQTAEPRQQHQQN
jgi:hypothetical protein